MLHFVPFGMSKECFLAVKLLLFLLLVARETQIHMIFIKKGTHIGKHSFRILAFKTEWEYYFWIRNYECKCVFNNFSPN